MIFGFSSVPSLQSGLKEDYLLRKVAHAAEYAVLTFLFCVVYKKRSDIVGVANVVISGLSALAYALTDEIHQTFISGRSGNYFDIGVDACGMVFMIILLVFISFQQKRNKPG
jgi:VanZ family protein